MKKPKMNDPLNEREKGQQFIERDILTGIIVDDEYCNKVCAVLERHGRHCLIADMSKMLSGWVLDYHKQYGTAPGGEIEPIYYEKLRNDKLAKDLAEDIEVFLGGLSDSYEQQEEFNVLHLIKRTQDYFNKNLYAEWQDEIRRATEAGEFDQAEKLRQDFQLVLFDNPETEIIKAGDLYDMKIKKPKFLVKDFLPMGLTILAGKPKTGKSFWVLNLALSMAQKQPVFDHWQARYGQILYLSLEDPVYRFQDRMRNIEPNPDKKRLNKCLEPFFEWEKLGKGGLTRIERWLETHQKPVAIIIDTIAKVWSKKSGTGGGGLYAEEYNIFGELSNLARKYDVAIIVLHHTTKGKQADVFDEILGGSGTTGPADNLMVLSNEPNRPGYKKLSIRSKDTDEKHLAFYSHDGADWEFAGQAEEVQKSAERQTLYDWLQENQPAGLKEIKQACKNGEIDFSHNSANTVLRKMVSTGKLEQPEYGRYAVTGWVDQQASRKVGTKLRRLNGI
ncbi:MAG: AAA family ATPase [Balneolales bacterium]